MDRASDVRLTLHFLEVAVVGEYPIQAAVLFCQAGDEGINQFEIILRWFSSEYLRQFRVSGGLIAACTFDQVSDLSEVC